MCLEKILKTAKENAVDYVLFAGDFWDAAITNTAASGFPEYVNLVKEIASVSKTVMISGTPTHEPYGSLEVFKTCGVDVFSDVAFQSYEDLDLLLLPEPRRSDYVKKTSKEIDSLISAKYRKAISNVRKKDKPLVIMYHGDVESAVYQNGFKVSTATAISQELLQATWADYIALGHIHSRQELFDNCWYAGSCYPKNMGETHDCSFNLVTIDDKTTVEKVSFGFPQNETIIATVEDFEAIKKRDFTNKNVLIKLHIEKSLKGVTYEDKLKEIKDATNANSVAIKYIYVTTQDIRAKEITEKKTLLEKFKLYMDMNGLKSNDNQERILGLIEERIQVESTFPSDVFELEYLSLRGSLGLKDGLGVDDFEIDFNSFQDGTIAIIGNNGKGKTTIIENCHPFPQMLTRAGSLKDHFLLKDSHRILIYRTSKGRIKITMQIDAVSKGSESKYFVESEVNGEWVPYRSVDGSLSSYKDFVDKTFGSLDVFLRTSFFAREQIKSVPDLSRATRGEKIALFSSLAGIDYFTQVLDLAKQAEKEEQEQLSKTKLEVLQCTTLKGNVDKARTSISEKESELTVIRGKKQPYVEELEELTKKQKVIEEQVLIYKENKKQYESVCKEFDEALKNSSEQESKVTKIKEILANANAEESTAKCDNLQKEVDTLNEKSNELKKKIKALKSKKVFTSEKSERLDFLIAEINRTEVLRTRNMNNCIQVEDKCPTCGQELPADKKAQLKHITDEANAKDKELSEKIASLSFEKDVLSDEQKKQKSIEKDISKHQDELDKVNDKIEKLEDELSDIQEQQYMITKHQDRLSMELELLEKANNSLEKITVRKQELEEALSSDQEDYSLEICNLEQQLKVLEINETKLSTEISILKDNIESWKMALDNLADIDKKSKELEENIKDLQVIEKAFSNTGIPTIELDSVAPEISDITNNILAETYGDRFSVSFTTQREGSSGKKIEDFVINVFDSDKGRMKTLDLLCSGESIWIKQALFFAFSVLRSRRTGFCFRTRFMDESDGALDATARVLYLKMIEAAHKACNARISILITHSSELKEIIEQKIEL